MRTLVRAKKRTNTGGVITFGPQQYFLLDVGGVCSADDVVYNALSPSAKAALPTSKPATATAWIDRSCGGTSEVQPAVVTEFLDQTFTSATVRNITIPAEYFSGGNLTFEGTRGDLAPLADGITFTPSTRTFTLPSTLTGEWYILRIVATNSVGTIDDKFSVHLTYNAGTVTPIQPGVPGDPAGYGIVSTFTY